MLDMPISELAIILPVFILSLCVHEYAHARVAMHFGDYTAKAAGRVTLNPLKHIDPIGLITLLLVGFGWAKPVPVNPLHMRQRPMSEIFVSLAGPASNLAIAVVTALVLRTVLSFEHDVTEFTTLDMVLIYIGMMNVALFIFNLLPIFPLDGHHILREFLPASQRIPYQYWQMRYGQWVLLALVFGPRLMNLPKEVNPIHLLFAASNKIIFLIAGI